MTICKECRWVRGGWWTLDWTRVHCRAPTLPVESHTDYATGESRKRTLTRCAMINRGNCPHFEAKL